MKGRTHLPTAGGQVRGYQAGMAPRLVMLFEGSWNAKKRPPLPGFEVRDSGGRFMCAQASRSMPGGVSRSGSGNGSWWSAAGGADPGAAGWVARCG